MGELFLDTETIGFHGLPVIVQFALGDGPIHIHNFWTNKVRDSLDLIESFLEHQIVGFNLSFDWFHIYKIYTVLKMYADEYDGYDHYPDGYVDEIGVIEEKARFVDYCLKPKGACDLMLLARKGPFQSLMKRDPIRIRRVPTQLAFLLAEELERRVQFDEIYFTKSKDKSAAKWKVFDTKNTAFKEVRLSFNASAGLKPLCRHIFKIDEEVVNYREIEISKKFIPNEVGYAPFAKALAPKAPIDWNGTWPDVAMAHINHWEFNDKAREYAKNDVVYTRRLYKEFFGSPGVDTDSILACMVACCRWSGYSVDIEKLKDLKAKCLEKLGFDKYNIATFRNREVTMEIIHKFGTAIMAPKAVKKYLLEVMSPTESLVLENSTKRTILELVAKEFAESNPPAATRAQEVLDARQAKKELEGYEKLIRAGRFHASFKIIGTLSSRMSGDNQLNAQGIKQRPDIRAAFTLADDRETLNGGDFSAFEVSLAAKEFNDPKLMADLQAGIQIHAVFASMLFPDFDYDAVMASKGISNGLYDKGKKGIFSIFYGGQVFTLITRLGVEEEDAERAYAALRRKYTGIALFDIGIQKDFGALTQPGGIGTKITWTDPKEYVESFLGFKRYFTLENRVMRALFDLARDTPKSWREINIKVMRRDRFQTGAGATSSALYGAAFGIQCRTIRASKNHKIQSPGAEITKATQAAIWELQPVGIHSWIVKPMNVHDEIMCPTKRGYEDQVKEKALGCVERFKVQVPLLKLDWVEKMDDWSGKSGKKKVQPTEVLI